MEEMKEFLAKPWVARIATLRPDKSPYLSTVWYEYDHPFFYLGARAKSRWALHLKDDPRISIHVAEDVAPFTRILVEGRAEILDGPIGIRGRWIEVANKMALRYLGEHGPDYLIPTMERPRYWIRVNPEKVTSWTGVEWHRRYL